MADDPMTIATFSSPTELHVVNLALEAAGIRCFVQDEETVGALWHAGAAFGGVKLQVASSNTKRALSILESVRTLQSKTDSADAQDSEQGEWTCPECRVTVDAGFEVCWSCSAEKSPSAATDDLASTSLEKSSIETIQDEAQPTELDSIDHSNPIRRKHAKLLLAVYLVFPIGMIVLVFVFGMFELAHKTIDGFSSIAPLLVLLFFVFLALKPLRDQVTNSTEETNDDTNKR
jgi:hypothetical protein